MLNISTVALLTLIFLLPTACKSRVASTELRVIGGAPSDDAASRAVWQLRLKVGDVRYSSCTSSAISPSVLLTARHCVDKNSLSTDFKELVLRAKLFSDNKSAINATQDKVAKFDSMKIESMIELVQDNNAVVLGPDDIAEVILQEPIKVMFNNIFNTSLPNHSSDGLAMILLKKPLLRDIIQLSDEGPKTPAIRDIRRYASWAFEANPAPEKARVIGFSPNDVKVDFASYRFLVSFTGDVPKIKPILVDSKLSAQASRWPNQNLDLLSIKKAVPDQLLSGENTITGVSPYEFSPLISDKIGGVIFLSQMYISNRAPIVASDSYCARQIGKEAKDSALTFNGDSGGPLLFAETNKIIGVTSGMFATGIMFDLGLPASVLEQTRKINNQCTEDILAATPTAGVGLHAYYMNLCEPIFRDFITSVATKNSAVFPSEIPKLCRL